MADKANEKNSQSKSLPKGESSDFMARLQKKLEAKQGKKDSTTEPGALANKEAVQRTKTTTFEERSSSIQNDKRSVKTAQTEEVGSKKSVKAVIKTFAIILASIAIIAVCVLGGYVVYLQSSYKRIEDMKYIQVQDNQTNRIVIGTDYSIATFNIGFGAYSQGFSFFMDEGLMESGESTKGEYSRAYNKEEVENNTKGAISLVQNQALSDFYFFQEVDTDSSRSYYVDQSQMIRDSFSNYSSSFATNFHTGQLFYPLSEPIGKINSGIMTMSKYSVNYSIRRSLPVTNNFIEKFFDLDRCFMVTKVPIYNSNKELVLINAHLSAYDDGDIRTQQLAVLYEYINYEYNTKGNYVIVGGDFNHSLAGDASVFKNKMQVPDWCKSLPDEYSEAKFNEIGFNINYDLSTTIGSCRDSSRYYEEGVNLEVILDGFITSANVLVKKVETIDGDFKNSDHNPVRIEFCLQ